MFKRSVAAVLIAMCAAIGPRPAWAQDVKGPTYELKLRDGSRIYGAIERQTDEQIEFRTIGGALITAQAADVLALKEVKGTLVAGEFLPDDPNQTRLFFGPTARSLPKGAVSFGTYEFIMPFVQVGVTDRFSIGGGTPLLFGFDESERPFWITPKFQVIDRGKLSAAVGSLHLLASGHNAGIGYGVVTVSQPAGSLSMGAGIAFDDDGGRSPVVMIGGDGMVVLRGVEDQKAFDQGMNNATTARALLVLFERLGRGEAVSAKADAEMIAVLKRQKFNDAIPGGVPAGTSVAHKTGSITRIQHDAGIVYGRRPYVLIVLVRGIQDQKVSTALIASISRAVWEHVAGR